MSLSSLDPGRCVDVRPVHEGEIPKLARFIDENGYIEHSRIIVTRDEDLEYVIVDGRHRVVCCQQLLAEEKLRPNFCLPAIVLIESTPRHVLLRLATGMLNFFVGFHKFFRTLTSYAIVFAGLNQVSERVVKDTPFDRIYVIRRIIQDLTKRLRRKPTNPEISARALLEYGDAQLNLGTVTHYKPLALMRDEVLDLIRMACTGLPNVTVGKSQVIVPLMAQMKAHPSPMLVSF